MGRRPAKRPRTEAFPDRDEVGINSAHRANHDPFLMARVRLAAMVPLAARLGCSQEDAGERYDQMLDRLEQYLKDNNFLSSNTKEEKGTIQQGFDRFFAMHDNAIILDQFTVEPSREEALHAFSTNLRRTNIKDKRGRTIKKERKPSEE